MRSIQISTDVFAAIWAHRQPGEDSEDAILARVLNAALTPEEPMMPGYESAGLYDPRYNVRLPPGFEIFRVYKGREFRAVAAQNMWLRKDNGTGYPSLNELSRSIGTKTENAWFNWFFTADDGKSHPLSERRDPKTIRSRSVGNEFGSAGAYVKS